MAIVRNNLLLSGVSGAIGSQLVVRQTRHGVVLAKAPSKPRKQASAAQLDARARFRLAVKYAEGAAARVEYQELAAKRGTSAFAIARRDFLTPPEVRDIDVSRYRGLRGDVIEVTATDDVKVVDVRLRILSRKAKVIEQGQMIRSGEDAERWSYVAVVDAPSGELTVEVEAVDLPGHRTKLARERRV